MTCPGLASSATGKVNFLVENSGCRSEGGTTRTVAATWDLSGGTPPSQHSTKNSNTYRREKALNER